MTVDCLCDSCRAAGKIVEGLPKGEPLLDAHDATRTTMYRKDRIRCARGGDHLREFRLVPTSKTRRVVAACCDAPMFMEFTRGHWIDIYAHRLPAESAPPAEMRTMAGDLPAGTELPSDLPNLKSHSLSFFARLLAAWVAMRFRRPSINFVKGTLDVSAAR